MKTVAIFWVVAMVCLFGVGSAEEANELRKVRLRLHSELMIPVRRIYREFTELEEYVFSKLEAVAEEAKKNGSDNHCLVVEAKMHLSLIVYKHFRALRKCTDETTTEAISWLPKGNISEKDVDPYIPRALEKAAECNEAVVASLVQDIDNSRPSANQDCSSLRKLNRTILDQINFHESS